MASSKGYSPKADEAKDEDEPKSIHADRVSVEEENRRLYEEAVQGKTPEYNPRAKSDKD